MSLASRLITRIRYHGEALLVNMAYAVLGLLPISSASALGGYIAETIGPRLSRSNLARSNLARAMPELDKHQTNTIIKGMWNNIGRTFAEYPHVTRMDNKQVQEVAVLEGIEHIINASLSGKGSLFFTAHLANWEYTVKLSSSYGYPVHIVYRRSNNPGLNRLIHSLRDPYLAGSIPKGKEGSRQMLQTLKRGGRVGMIMDQKMNDGISVKFFGIDAMTAPAIARLALKYNYPILPVRSIRVDGIRHKVIVYPPISIPDSGDMHKDIDVIMGEINSIIEGWIREYPAQWFWLHNRWPDINK